MKYMQRGMTMLEVAVWIGVFTFVVLAIMSSVLYFYRTNTYTINQASAVSSAQRGMERMVRTIREVAYASDGAYPVVSMAANQFSFYADVDGDPFIEKVRYFVQGNTIVEGIVDPSGDPPVYTGAESTSVIADYVQNTAQGVTTFTYYDKNGALMIDYSKIADVRFVTVNLIIDVDTLQLPAALTLRSSAGMRNLVGN